VAAHGAGDLRAPVAIAVGDLQVVAEGKSSGAAPGCCMAWAVGNCRRSSREPPSHPLEKGLKRRIWVSR
jgi:hypothetical protein